MTPLCELAGYKSNHMYIKREDLLPFSFGGNKARKAIKFFAEIDAGQYDAVVTYGSSSSNHCRIVANMAAGRNLTCYIISPNEASKETYNSIMMKMFGAKIISVPVNDVSHTIDELIKDLEMKGLRPYFIPGGGHGNLGTQAYVDCFNEICAYEKDNQMHFDYLFFASGTGTTQAGLVCGGLMSKTTMKIVGISIARKNPRGRQIVVDSVKEFLNAAHVDIQDDIIEDAIIFTDEYIKDGYGSSDCQISNIIDQIMKTNGIPLDPIYTAKAYTGMIDYIDKNNINHKNILFIHTGGTPLFFDGLKEMHYAD